MCDVHVHMCQALLLICKMIVDLQHLHVLQHVRGLFILTFAQSQRGASA